VRLTLTKSEVHVALYVQLATVTLLPDVGCVDHVDLPLSNVYSLWHSTCSRCVPNVKFVCYFCSKLSHIFS